LGRGGTGVDEATELPQCAQPLGTVALIEDKAPSVDDQLPPGMRALVQMAERQNGGSTAKVDPLALLKLVAARSNCFLVVERGGGFDALQRERALAAGGSVANGQAFTGATLTAADYLLQAQVLYSDANSRGGGGGVGGAFGSAIGLKTKTLESQIMLSLVDVENRRAARGVNGIGPQEGRQPGRRRPAARHWRRCARRCLYLDRHRQDHVARHAGCLSQARHGRANPTDTGTALMDDEDTMVDHDESEPLTIEDRLRLRRTLAQRTRCSEHE
jgi:hypothetical protein